MADIKLFAIDNKVRELSSKHVALEKDLQNLIEDNMPDFFGITFLQSEFSTSNGGRIDSLGVDENNCPVILEYKRTVNENVINQGLFYLDWLMDHKADFEMLVMDKLGKNDSDLIDWSMPRLVCIANSFTKYDEYAVNQINRNIDLVRYVMFDDKHILFEMLNSKIATEKKEKIESKNIKKNKDKDFDDQYNTANDSIKKIYDSLRNYILAIGDDITENKLKLYTAFKKMRNVACIEIRNKHIMLYLRLNPDEIQLAEGFTRDVRNIGHWGTGELEVIIKNEEDFNKAKALISRAIEEN